MGLGANANTPVAVPGANISGVGNLGASTQKMLSDIQNVLTQQGMSFLIPANAKGISGSGSVFEFDIEEQDKLHLSAVPTANFVENNDFIDDHVVINPAEIELTGLVGEVVFKVPQGLQGLLSLVGNKLSALSAFVPNQGQGFIQASQKIVGQANSTVSQLNQGIQNAKNAVSFIQNPLGVGLNTRQQNAYISLFTLMYLKTVCSVLTPWAFYKSMIINDILFTQPEETKGQTEIVVKLLEWRTSSLQITNFDKSLFVNPNQAQSATPQNTGSIRGDSSTSPNTALYDISKSGASILNITTRVTP